MSKIELDITSANKAIIWFRSKMLMSLIGIVQVLISVGITNFHIINILTLFLFCLENMDIFSIYFNNITN